MTILAYSPAFGAAYNMRPALGLWEETRLITLTAHALWPGTEDIILNDDNAADCRKLIEASRFTFIAGAAGLAGGMLEMLGGQDWKGWARKQRFVPYWVDTPYWADAPLYNDLCAELEVKTVFAMMDLMAKAPEGAIPLCHPQTDTGRPEKPEWLTVMHSPRTFKKSVQKGTALIERVMNRLAWEFPELDYLTILDLSYADCLALKSEAHIFIDQIPAPGQPAGLGRSGEEGLAAGAVVLTALYGQEYLDGYFPPPPVVPVYDEAGLYQEMRQLCQADRAEIEARGQAGREWAKQYLFFPGWLDYVKEHLSGL